MIAPLPDRGVLEVTGDDRVAFLQGLVSNDVNDAAPGRAVWAALLTPQGKWLADFFILAETDRLLLDVEATHADMIAQRLSRYRLRAKVAVSRTSLQVTAGWGGDAPAGAVPDPRLPEAGWRLVADHAPPSTANAEDYDLHRLSLGLPAGSSDMEAEKTTLLEAGFDELNGVSWTKGCYMGQELTARTKYRGLLKRRLIPVGITGPLPHPGTPVFDADREIGIMRSGRGPRGLALLRLEAAEAKDLRCGEAVLSPTRPAWMGADQD